MEPNPCGSCITFQLASTQLSEHDIWANDPWTTVDCDLVPEAGKGGTGRANPSGGICANGDLGIIMGAGTFGICANKVLDKALNYVTMSRSAF